MKGTQGEIGRPGNPGPQGKNCPNNQSKYEKKIIFFVKNFQLLVDYPI